MPQDVPSIKDMIAARRQTTETERITHDLELGPHLSLTLAAFAEIGEANLNDVLKWLYSRRGLPDVAQTYKAVQTLVAKGHLEKRDKSGAGGRSMLRFAVTVSGIKALVETVASVDQRRHHIVTALASRRTAVHAD